MSSATPSTARSSLSAHPIGFWFIFWGEFAERCSFYGMRAILVTYMTAGLGFEDSSASGIMSYFLAGCYLLPLVGGYLADNYFGKYRTIVAFSLPYILGHVLLGIESVPFLYIALSLLAMGSGVIKPNVSALMGMTYDQQRPGQERLRSDAFAMFYGAINIGAAISMFALPWIRVGYGYRVAFLVPAVLMAAAFLLFALGKRFYAIETIRREPLTPVDRRQRWFVLRRIFGLFVVIVFFWSIFDQSTTTWTYFARDHLNLDVFSPIEGSWQYWIQCQIRDRFGKDLFGLQLPAESIQSLNAVLILLLLPPVTALWHWLPRIGLRLRPTDKMLVGFVLTTITMLIMAIAGHLATSSERLSLLWEVIPYVLITVAEICISVVGLELAFTVGPPTMKSFIMACWLLTVFFGNILNAQFTPLYNEELQFGGVRLALTPDHYFATYAVMMVLVTIAFVLVARRFNRMIGGPEPAKM